MEDCNYCNLRLIIVFNFCVIQSYLFQLLLLMSFITHIYHNLSKTLTVICYEHFIELRLVSTSHSGEIP